MNYVIADYGDGGSIDKHLVKAELHASREDFDGLIQKLIEYRDKHYPQQKEAPNE